MTIPYQQWDAVTLGPFLADIEQMLTAQPKGHTIFRRTYMLPNILEVYLRLNQRLIHGTPCRTLEIANVAIAPWAQGKGVFSALLYGLESIALRNGWVLFVENVINDILLDALRRREYERYAINCYFKSF